MGNLLTSGITVGVTIAFLAALFSLVPPVSFPPAIVGTISSLFGYIQGFSFLIALDQLFQVLIVILGIEGTMFIIKLAMKIYVRITKSGSN